MVTSSRRWVAISSKMDLSGGGAAEGVVVVAVGGGGAFEEFGPIGVGCCAGGAFVADTMAGSTNGAGVGESMTCNSKILLDRNLISE
jgi:hypothetical protein